MRLVKSTVDNQDVEKSYIGGAKAQSFTKDKSLKDSLFVNLGVFVAISFFGFIGVDSTD